MSVRAVKYKSHINASHMPMTGEELAFKQVPCPTCGSMLVKRNKKGTPIMFVACDKTFLPYCRFSIGMDETLEERSRRIYGKLSHHDTVIDVSPTVDRRLNGRGVIKL